jgi:hypothetical protein
MVIASIVTAAAARPKYAGLDRALPFAPSVVPGGGVTPQVWSLGGHVVPMPIQRRTDRFAPNQESPPREVVLR